MPGMAAVDTVEDVPLVVNRHVAFSEDLRFVGFDYSAATFAAHLRQTKDLGSAWLTFTFGVPALTVEAGVNVTTVTVSATKAAVDAIPYDLERGDNIEAWWDLLVDPAGAAAQFRFAQGPAIITAGATIP